MRCLCRRSPLLDRLRVRDRLRDLDRLPRRRSRLRDLLLRLLRRGDLLRPLSPLRSLPLRLPRCWWLGRRGWLPLLLLLLLRFWLRFRS